MAAVEIVAQSGEDFLVLFFDIDVEQRHTLRAEKTEFPVEDQANRSDHHRAKTDPFVAELIVSETQLDNSHIGSQQTRRKNAWTLLERIRDEHLPTLITTPLRNYDDMVLLEAAGAQKHADGTWLRFTVHFEPMQTFQTQLVDDPTPARARERAQTQLGTQSTTEAPPQLVSLLSSLLGES